MSSDRILVYLLISSSVLGIVSDTRTGMIVKRNRRFHLLPSEYQLPERWKSGRFLRSDPKYYDITYNEKKAAIPRDYSPTALPLTRLCAHNNCCSDSAGRCLTIPPKVPILLLATTNLFQQLKRSLAKQHFPSDDDMQTDGCHRLVPLSDGGSLRHRCTEIGLTV
ncbi:hypothetical protein AVEN_259872-1 [Araneus ventricosus]|uniref:Uncharacterized protein n=1 Tax=Araneus ventricosus TaxID=182803 RepID=A0A4Y2DRB5_ARAVE|nr:hypothetical protein AVEN_259872-1 [Araneus ventricosus]